MWGRFLWKIFKYPRGRRHVAFAPGWMGWFSALLGIALVGGAVPCAAQTEPAAESGVFLIQSSGRRIGTERFQIRRGASGWEVSGELQLEAPGSPRVSETSSLQVDAKWKPVAYERRQQAPQKGNLTVEFGAEATTLVSKTEAGDQEQVFLLPQQNLVVLDTNFFHHYALLVRQYDAARPGPQNFNVFVPQEATPSMISLTLLGKETLRINDAARELNHFQAATEDIKIEIWATEEREIQRIEIPPANLEIVRQN